MVIKSFKDRDRKLIDTKKVYRDVINKVDNIRIIEIDGNYYAQPDELDAEPLVDVCNGLIVQ